MQASNDGKPDFYIYPDGNADSGVAPFVMMSNPNGPGYRFIMPDPEMALGASLTLDLGDFDADGHDDMIIKNLSQVQTELDDVIIFAPKAANAIPGGYGEGQGYVQVDDQFEQFFDQLYNITVNPNYFSENDEVLITPFNYVVQLDTWGLCIPTSSGDINGSVTAFPICNGAEFWWQFQPSYTVLDDFVQIFKVIKGTTDLSEWHPATNLLRCVLWCPIQPQYPQSGGIFNKGEIVAGSWSAKRVSESVGGILGRSYAEGDLNQEDGPGWEDDMSLIERNRYRFLRLIIWEHTILEALGTNTDAVICSSGSGVTIKRESECPTPGGVITRDAAIADPDLRGEYVKQKFEEFSAKMDVSYPFVDSETGQTIYRPGAIGIPVVVYDGVSNVEATAYVVRLEPYMVVTPYFFDLDPPYIAEEMTPEQKDVMKCLSIEETEMYVYHHEFIHMTKSNIDKWSPYDTDGQPRDDDTPRSKKAEEVDATTKTVAWIKSTFPHPPYPQCLE